MWQQQDMTRRITHPAARCGRAGCGATRRRRPRLPARASAACSRWRCTAATSCWRLARLTRRRCRSCLPPAADQPAPQAHPSLPPVSHGTPTLPKRLRREETRREVRRLPQGRIVPVSSRAGRECSSDRVSLIYLIFAFNVHSFSFLSFMCFRRETGYPHTVLWASATAERMRSESTI